MQREKLRLSLNAKQFRVKSTKQLKPIEKHTHNLLQFRAKSQPISSHRNFSLKITKTGKETHAQNRNFADQTIRAYTTKSSSLIMNQRSNRKQGLPNPDRNLGNFHETIISIQ